MLDVHPAHRAASTWRDFIIRIATIAVGLLIAIGLEQTVEFFHHRHLAREARASIQRETEDNLGILQKNMEAMTADRRQLMEILDLLNSGAPDAQVIPHLKYTWFTVRQHEAAWEAAKIDGSRAHIPQRDWQYQLCLCDSREH